MISFVLMGKLMALGKGATSVTVGATLGMGVVLWFALTVLAPFLAPGSVIGAIALAGICALGAAVYGGLRALLGIVRLTELRFVLRRQPGLRSVDPDEQP